MKRIRIVFFTNLAAFLLGCNNGSDEAKLFFLKGVEAQKKGNVAQSIKYYTEAIKNRADFADAYYNRSQLYQNPELAIEDLKRAVEADPSFDEAQVALASLYLESGKISEGIKALKEYHADTSAGYHNTMGKLLFADNEFMKAGSFLKKAVELKPKSSEYQSDLGTWHFKVRDFKKASQFFKQALKIDSTNLIAMNNEALIDCINANYSDAASKTSFVYGRQKDMIFKTNFHYASIKSGNADKIITEIKANYDLQNPGSVRNLGLITDGLEKLKLLENAYQSDPELVLIETDLGLAYIKSGNVKTGCDLIEKSKKYGSVEAQKIFDQYCLK